MRIRLTCTNDACRSVITVSPLPGEVSSIACPRCSQAHPVRGSNTLQAGPIERCPCCGGDELFVRKDFPQKLGLAAVILAGTISCVLFANHQTMAALGVLLVLMIVDAIIYGLVSRVTTCYRCRAQFRGVPVNPLHKGFDLATSEKYR